MAKEAKTRYPVHELIRERWSARAFSEKNITSDEIHTLLEAAAWAPSAMNEQPWHYYFAMRDTPGFEAMWDCLLPGNKPWAKEASALVLCVGYKDLVKTGQFNRHYMHDCGMANANLLLQATSMGIYGHIMGGYDSNQVRAVFDLQENEEDICFIALGYIGSPDHLIEPFKTRETSPRHRKPLEQISFDKSHMHDHQSSPAYSTT